MAYARIKLIQHNYTKYRIQIEFDGSLEIYYRSRLYYSKKAALEHGIEVIKAIGLKFNPNYITIEGLKE